ncbi:MAG TPA: SBBP repeat-containing protein [Planctomycetota bacterium]|nr:SBBP repeat-containing protein [Planctomycetota bacterium]
MERTSARPLTPCRTALQSFIVLLIILALIAILPRANAEEPAETRGLQWARLLGGRLDDYPLALAVDAAGNIYLGGSTRSGDFPGRTPTSDLSVDDAFVTKMSPSGEVLWTVFMDGSASGSIHALIADPSGGVIVGGYAQPADIPLVNEPRVKAGECNFVARLDSAGNRQWTTFLPGAARNGSLVVDPSGAIIAAAKTTSDRLHVTRLDPLGRVEWAVTLIKNRQCLVTGAAVDAGGNIFILDAEFLTKLTPSGQVIWSTVIAEGYSNTSNGLAVDHDGNAFVTGTTMSSDFPVTDGLNVGESGSGRDAFLAKFTPAGTREWSTRLGGAWEDEGCAVACDANGNAFVTGRTYSGGFPAAGRLPAAGTPGFCGAYVTAFAPSGVVRWYMLFGGDDWESGFAIAADGPGSLIVAGSTSSTFFPTSSTTFARNSGKCDCFVARLKVGPHVIVRSEPGPVQITGGKPGLADYTAPCRPDEIATLEAPATATIGGESHAFIRWIVDGQPLADGQAVAQLHVTGYHTATAIYESSVVSIRSQPSARLEITGDLTIFTDSDIRVPRRQTLSLQAPAIIGAEGARHEFQHWLIDGVEAPSNDKRQVTVFTDTDHTVVAIYRIITYNMPIQSKPSGIEISGDNPGITEYTVQCTDKDTLNLTAPLTAYVDGKRYCFQRWEHSINKWKTRQLAVKGVSYLHAVYAPADCLIILKSPKAGAIKRAGIYCGEAIACATGEVVSLTAAGISNEGLSYYPAGWLLDGQPQPAGTLTFTAQGDHVVEALYSNAASFTVSASIPGVEITGTHPGTAEYAAACRYGERIELLAPATVMLDGSEYRFVRWKVNGSAKPYGNPSISVSAPATCAAFAEYTCDAPAIIVTSTPITGLSIEGGRPGVTDYTIACEYGESVSLTAPLLLPATSECGEAAFTGWIVDGSNTILGANSTTSVTVCGTRTAQATYRTDRRVLTASSSPPGILQSTTIEAHMTTTYVFAPEGSVVDDEFYYFHHWLRDGVEIPNAPSRMLNLLMDAHHHVEAVYTTVPFRLEVQSVPASGIAISCGNACYPTDCALACSRGQKVALSAPMKATVDGLTYCFTNWLVDGYTSTASTLNVTVTEDRTVVAVYTPALLLQVQSTPVSGILITADGVSHETDFILNCATGERIKLRAPKQAVVGDLTFFFEHWLIDGEQSSADLLDVTVTKDCTAIAVYTPSTCKLRVESTPISGARVNAVGWTRSTSFTLPCRTGDKITLTAAAKSKINEQTVFFEYWLIDGERSPFNPVSITVTEDRTAVAVHTTDSFALNVQSTPVSGISIKAGGVTQRTNFIEACGIGEVVKLSAPATSTVNGVQFYFGCWLVDGVRDSSNPIEVAVTKDRTVVADYSATPFELRVESTPVSGILIDCGNASALTSFSMPCGPGEISVTAPVTGDCDGRRYYFVRWIVDGQQKALDSRTAKILMAKDATAVAVYTEQPPTVTVKSWPVGGVSISGSAPGVTDYTVVVDKAAPDISLTAPATYTVDGCIYTFAGWSFDGAQIFPSSDRLTTLARTLGAGAHVAEAAYTRVAIITIKGPADRGEAVLPAGGGRFAVDIYMRDADYLAAVQAQLAFTAPDGSAGGFTISRFAECDIPPDAAFADAMIEYNKVRFAEAWPFFVNDAFGFMLWKRSVSISKDTRVFTVTFDYGPDAFGEYSITMDDFGTLLACSVDADHVASTPYSTIAGKVVIGDVSPLAARAVLAGDIDGDCAVTEADLILARNQLGQAQPAGSPPSADVNADGRVNVLDLIFIRNQLGARCE